MGSFSPSLVKVSITYTGSVAGANGDTTDSGTVVTGKTRDVHAGWPIQLGAVITPAGFANNYKQFTWTISGAGGNGSAAINGFCANAAIGAALLAGATNNEGVVVPLDPGSDTQSTCPDPSSPVILKYYYYTKSGSETASVVSGQYEIRFSVGHLESNWLKVAIKPPVIQLLAGRILQPTSEDWPKGGKNKSGGVQVRLFGLAHAGKAQPMGVWVYLRAGGHGRENAELTGNRFLGLRAIQVDVWPGGAAEEAASSMVSRRWSIRAGVTALRRYRASPGVCLILMLP